MYSHHKKYKRNIKWFTIKYTYISFQPLLNSAATLFQKRHYSDVIITTKASQITGLSIVSSAVCSGVYQRKLQSSAPMAFVKGIHWWPVDSPHKGPVTWKMFPIEDVIITTLEHGVQAPAATHLWGPWRLKQIQRAWIYDYIPQYSVGWHWINYPCPWYLFWHQSLSCFFNENRMWHFDHHEISEIT